LSLNKDSFSIFKDMEEVRMSKGFKFDPVKILAELINDPRIMWYYFGINTNLWLDGTPMENYRNSRGI